MNALMDYLSAHCCKGAGCGVVPVRGCATTP